MRYRIVEKDAFRVVGRKARVPLVYEGHNPAIVEFVRSIDAATLRRLAELSDQEPRGIVAAVHNFAAARLDAPEGTELDYYHGVVTGADAPGDMDVLPVPAGTWAVFEVSGEAPQAIQYLWRDVFTEWFPSNPYQSVPGPEILRTVLSEDGARAEAELWIPVERTLA